MDSINEQSPPGKAAGITFEVGVCKLYPGEKLPRHDPRWGAHTRNFHAETHNIESLAQVVAVNGFAISAVMRKSYRHEDNWEHGQHIALDYDQETKESSIEELITTPFIEDHAAIVYETPSSTPGKPRSRLVFVVNQPFDSAKDYRQATEALIQKFSGVDEACKDPAHFFYGRPDAKHVILGNVLYRDILQ